MERGNKTKPEKTRENWGKLGKTKVRHTIN